MKFIEELTTKHLNLDKILNLGPSERETIMQLYYEMHDSINGKSGSIGNMSLPGGVVMDTIKATVIFNTLIEYGYLVTRREENLDKILN